VNARKTIVTSPAVTRLCSTGEDLRQEFLVCLRERIEAVKKHDNIFDSEIKALSDKAAEARIQWAAHRQFCVTCCSDLDPSEWPDK
jgi:hypothetical protein